MSHVKRQDDPVSAPSATGLANSAITALSTGINTASNLALDTIAGTGTVSAPPLAFTGTSEFSSTQTSSSLLRGTTGSTPDPSTVAASSTKPISMSTVVATCIGAFIGASALIIFSVYVYRRYSRSLEQSLKSREHSSSRNIHGNEQRRRSRLETWNKLKEDGDEDKWEDFYQTKEAKDTGLTDVTPMETMFRKTPSMRTAYTHTMDGADFSFPSSYAEFDPNLAATLKLSNSEPQPLLKSTGMGEPSWVESNYSTHSKLSSQMSLMRNIALRTPPPTISHLHRWESAEVVDFSEGQAAEIVNPFDDDEERKSYHNPFFSAKDDGPRRQRSDSTSTTRSRSRSRANSNATVTRANINAKGKERIQRSASVSNDASANPFADVHANELPRPAFISHEASSSTSSTDKEEKERALKSLVDALDLPVDEVRNRMRIESMQPSIVSETSSVYVSDVADDFPLPPTSPGRAPNPSNSITVPRMF